MMNPLWETIRSLTGLVCPPFSSRERLPIRPTGGGAVPGGSKQIVEAGVHSLSEQGTVKVPSGYKPSHRRKTVWE